MHVHLLGNVLLYSTLNLQRASWEQKHIPALKASEVLCGFDKMKIMHFYECSPDVGLQLEAFSVFLGQM